MQADQIQAAGDGGVAIDDHERRHVLHDFGKPADDRMFPDPAKLMRGGKAGNDRVISDHTMPREAAVVRKNDVIAELAVVRDMGVAEKQIVRADPGRELLMRAAMHRAVFAEDVMITHLKCGWLTDVFQILGLTADHREGEKLVMFSKGRGAFQHHMAVEHAFIAEGDVGSDDAIRADADIFSKLGFR